MKNSFYSFQASIDCYIKFHLLSANILQFKFVKSRRCINNTGTRISGLINVSVIQPTIQISM